MERRNVAASSLERNGSIIIVANIEQAIELANHYAPEHLSLIVENAPLYIDKIENAGGIFVGEDSPEVLGDYTAGPSHVMPTGGTARFSSPLTTDDFLKVISVVSVNKEALKALGPAAMTIAKAEGFSGHAQAVDIRLSRS
jgi:histidinol dehydrogenase